MEEGEGRRVKEEWKGKGVGGEGGEWEGKEVGEEGEGWKGKEVGEEGEEENQDCEVASMGICR